jgi:endoglucanase Acf2
VLNVLLDRTIQQNDLSFVFELPKLKSAINAPLLQIHRMTDRPYIRADLDVEASLNLLGHRDIVYSIRKSCFFPTLSRLRSALLFNAMHHIRHLKCSLINRFRRKKHRQARNRPLTESLQESSRHSVPTFTSLLISSDAHSDDRNLSVNVLDTLPIPNTDTESHHGSDDSAYRPSEEWAAVNIPFTREERRLSLSRNLIRLPPALPQSIPVSQQVTKRRSFSYFINRATPTNTWWRNLISGTGAKKICCYPYMIRLSAENGSYVEFCWPKIHIIESALWRSWETDWQLRWSLKSEKRATFHRVLIDFDDLSATVEWRPKNTAKFQHAWVRQYLVKATPYITLQFHQIPQIQLVAAHPIVSIEQHNQHSWKVGLKNQQVWAIFIIPEQDQHASTLSLDDASSQIGATYKTWTKIHNNKLEMVIHDDVPFTGVIRLAAVPPPVDESFELLSKHAPVYPTGGTFSWRFAEHGMHEQDSYHTGPTQAVPTTLETRFHYRKAGSDLNIPLLMLTLPHHAHTLVEPRPDPHFFDMGRGYRCAKGRMYAVIGDCWTMIDTKPNVKWREDFDLSCLTEAQRNTLIEALRLDLQQITTSIGRKTRLSAASTARLARLALIAEHLGCRDAEKIALDQLALALECWLHPQGQCAFRYDATHGEIVSPDDMPDYQEMAAAGNTYNTHRFHTAYIVYAAAVLGRRRPDWWHTYRDAALAICMDYMYVPSDRNTERNPFPRLRYFDAFDGHSWSTGTSVSIYGQSQQNMSESVCAYYAAVLIAQVDHRPELSQAALVLLSSELRTARTYWQMSPPPAHPLVPKDPVRFVLDIHDVSLPNQGITSSDLRQWDVNQHHSTPITNSDYLGRDQDELYGMPTIYPAPFRYCGTAGIVWPAKINHATWFSSMPEHVHATQLSPFLPTHITLLDPGWIRRVWPLLKEAMQRSTLPMDVGWRGKLMMIGAACSSYSELQQIWTEISSLPPSAPMGDACWDDIDSKTNALYWTAAHLALKVAQDAQSL